MIEKAVATGLAFEREQMITDVNENIEGTLYNSATGIFGLLPTHEREICTGDIDDSVFQRMKKIPAYKPRNVLAAQQQGTPEATEVMMNA